MVLRSVHIGTRGSGRAQRRLTNRHYSSTRDSSSV